MIMIAWDFKIMDKKINRIKFTFSNLKNKNAALIPYIVAGDPTTTITVPLMHSLVEAGADIIELGMPFSDPMADGKTIQHAMERSLDNGVNLPGIISYVKEFRKNNISTPIVLMGYANPIERFGQDKFVEEISNAGVDGILIVDYPPEEIESFSKLLIDKNIYPIFLLSPTSDEKRIKLISSIANGYVYYVSLKGVTGSNHIDLNDIEEHIKLIRKYIKLPVGVGFGIRDAKTAKSISKIADAVIIGSKIIDEMQGAFLKYELNLDKDKAVIHAVNTWLKTVNSSILISS